MGDFSSLSLCLILCCFCYYVQRRTGYTLVGRNLLVDLEEETIVNSLPSIQPNPFEQADLLQQPIFRRALNDSSGQGLCFFSITDAKFMSYVPSFVYSALKSHPEAKVFVASPDPIDERVGQALRAFFDTESSLFSMIDRFKVFQSPELQRLPRKVGKSDNMAAARFFLSQLGY